MAHQDGRTDAWDRLWMLLNLELWFRTFIDGEGIQTLPASSNPVPLMAHGESSSRRVAGEPAA